MRERLAFALFPVVAMSLTGCECITVPANDSVRPHAALTITYQDPEASGFQEVAVTITSTELADPPPLRLPAQWPIQVLYSGNDDGGVQTLTLESDFLDPTTITNPDGSISYALIAGPPAPNGDFSSCAKVTRILHFDWTIGGNWELKVAAVDFHGNQATTRPLRIGPE